MVFITGQQRKQIIKKLTSSFDGVRDMLDSIQLETKSNDLKKQGESIYIGHQFCTLVHTFICQYEKYKNQEVLLSDALVIKVNTE